MTEPIPTDRTRTKHIVLVVCGALIALATGLGLWAIIARPGASVHKQVEIEPAQPTVAATMPAPPASLSGTATTTGTVSTLPSGASAAPGAIKVPGTVVTTAGYQRVPRVAYRLRNAINVAAEDGSGARVIAQSAEGPYALSPDGGTLALVEQGRLLLISVATGARITVGPAEAAAPVWEPGSGKVLFVRMKSSGAGMPEVWRVGRDGAGVALLGQGSAGAVSPNGRVVVIRPPDAGFTTREEAMHISVSTGGAFKQIPLTGQPTSVAASDNRLFVGLVDEAGRPSLISLAIDGSGTPKQILGVPEGSTGVVWGAIALSPDGSRLAAAATGDDGFSRITVVPSAGGTGKVVTPRRDGELYGWTAKGDGLFFFEGNLYQGQQSSLVRVQADGTKRTVIMGGAQ